MSKSDFRKTMGKLWYFIWEDNSIWSWIVNVGLAFLLIKFIVYPGLGLIFSTGYPIVAVVSGSMEHDGASIDQWYAANHEFYSRYNITENEFTDYPYRNGFNTGDIMVLMGTKPEKIERGDVIVFQSRRPDPIIHRVIKVWTTDDGNGVEYHYQTKGDHNKISIRDATLNELDIGEKQVIGKAVFRVPYLGWIKILFVKFLNILGVTI